jgi:hypothetical protein
MEASKSSFAFLGILLRSILVLQLQNPPKEPVMQAKKVPNSQSNQRMLLWALRDQRTQAETSPD